MLPHLLACSLTHSLVHTHIVCQLHMYICTLSLSPQPVLVVGVDNQLTSNLWTPQSFSRDFGKDYSELVDCRWGYPLPHYPSHIFWDGFDDISRRLREPNSREPRLLKQKDWPPGEDFCEKLPRR